MKRNTIELVDSPRQFAAHEMFFSRTNAKGVIQAGNDVFVRISGFSKAELIGRAHNIIRHPDMPRAVFRIVWEHLAEGRAVAGYVKNLAADGCYYWVVALIAPAKDGFLSVRFKPSSTLHPIVEALYRDMRAIEVDAQERGESSEHGMQLSTDRLSGALTTLGFSSYDMFMDHMLQEELTARDAAIARGDIPLLPEWTAGTEDRGFRAISNNSLTAYQQIGLLRDALEGYAERNDELREQLMSLARLSRVSRLVAMNIVIKAAQLGDEGRCIGVVAGFLSGVSTQLFTACEALSAQTQPVSTGLRAISFALAAARLQLEMVMLFCHELAVGDGKQTDASAIDVDTFVTAFEYTIQSLTDEMNAVESALTGVDGYSDTAYKLTMAMQMAQLTGSVEASWVSSDESLTQSFMDVRNQTEESRLQITRLRETISTFDFLARGAPAIIRRTIDAIRSIQQPASVSRAPVQQLEEGLPSGTRGALA